MTARVLLTKIGLDGHDRGLRMIALELRDRGVEVVLLGVVTTPAAIAQTASDEDVDAIGVSVLSGAHMTLVPRLLELLAADGLADLPVVCGGTIPSDDVLALLDLGVARVCPTGTTVTEAADALIEACEATSVGVER
jgi:methylmalonyl-CoA mutase cobalamin-binding domain/chain